MTDIMDIDRLTAMMRDVGVQKLYVKRLAPNDNSKNQPYFGGDFSVLNILPYAEVTAESLGKVPNFKAKTDFHWLLDDGTIEHAKSAQFILYPKYPEVRFSGFLKGCDCAPSAVMNSRAEGRLLFLGVTSNRRIVGYAVMGDSSLASSFEVLTDLTAIGVFIEIPVDGLGQDSRQLLLSELRRIILLEWITAKKLLKSGDFGDCNAPNCGGMTLEAELGILPNGYSEPDFHGWEVKQHAVTNLDKPHRSVITLMTPEPTAGFYRDRGVIAFIRKYGYTDRRGREDRLNFGGLHKVGERHHLTGLTLNIDGFDPVSQKITRPDGGVILSDDAGEIAAEWKFTNILEHWQRKHSRAVYVPSMKRMNPRQYRYGQNIRLGIGTDPIKLLQAMSAKAVYYDPGIKLENASSPNPQTKRRSQFRIDISNIESLYEIVELVDLLGD